MEAIPGDLLEEFSEIAGKRGATYARRWYLRQSLRPNEMRDSTAENTCHYVASKSHLLPSFGPQFAAAATGDIALYDRKPDQTLSALTEIRRLKRASYEGEPALSSEVSSPAVVDGTCALGRTLETTSDLRRSTR